MYSNFSNIRVRQNKNNRNANKRRLTRLSKARLLSEYHNTLFNYIDGVLHPEKAVTTGNIPKAPNYVSIPTSSITFREAFDIDPDKNGEFILFWTPNFLATNEQIKNMTSNAATDYSRNWLGGFSDDFNMYGYYPISSYQPPASFTKYRLVSAGCKITYKGPVINRAGIISHCLSYRSFPMVMYKEDDQDFMPETVFQTLDPRYWGTDLRNLDVTTIQNGMWNNVQNVQKNQTVFTVAVPTDPSDFIFEDDGFFYASASADSKLQQRTASYTDGNGTLQYYNFFPQLAQDGTPCSYIFKGTDLTTDAKLYVEQFYNFEVIPTEESAPILRPRKTDLTSKQLDLAKDVITTTLDKVKGNVGTINTQLIDDLIDADSQRASNFALDVDEIMNSSNQITNQVKKAVKNLNQFEKDLKAKSVQKTKQNWKKLKSFGKKIFTKENIKFITELAASLANAKK